YDRKLRSGIRIANADEARHVFTDLRVAQCPRIVGPLRHLAARSVSGKILSERTADHRCLQRRFALFLGEALCRIDDSAVVELNSTSSPDWPSNIQCRFRIFGSDTDSPIRCDTHLFLLTIGEEIAGPKG